VTVGVDAGTAGLALATAGAARAAVAMTAAVKVLTVMCGLSGRSFPYALAVSVMPPSKSRKMDG
jgi:hypothetical protein